LLLRRLGGFVVKSKEDPKFQGVANVKIIFDVDDTCQRLREAGFKAGMLRGKGSSEPHVKVEFADGDTSALISRSAVQIYSCQPGKIFDAASRLEKQLGLKSGDLLLTMRRLQPPQKSVVTLENEFIRLRSQSREQEEQFDKLADIMCRMIEELRRLDPETRRKIDPILKKAIRAWAEMKPTT
jgi:hypothetical protein